jgi:hypothetical protein
MYQFFPIQLYLYANPKSETLNRRSTTILFPQTPYPILDAGINYGKEGLECQQQERLPWKFPQSF